MIHDLRRVAGEAESKQVDQETVRRVIRLIDYFKGHLPRVEKQLERTGLDEPDRHYNRLKPLGTLTVRDAQRRGVASSASLVEVVFQVWEQRGYGHREQTRKNQTTFQFDT